MSAAVEPIPRRLLSDAVHERLLQRVLAAEPDEALPSERTLSEAYGVNRHAVREAIKRLQQAGLVQVAQGGATRVCDWRRTAGLDLLTSLVASARGPERRELVLAIVEMRACVGADVARRCAERAPQAAAAALEAGGDDDYERYVGFWEALADGAGNVAYRLALNTLVTADRAGGIDPQTYAPEARDREAQRALAAAIAAGDGDAAAALAAELLNRTVEVLSA